MRTQAEKGRLFQELHQRPGILLVPNPWDAGTARILLLTDPACKASALLQDSREPGIVAGDQAAADDVGPLGAREEHHRHFRQTGLLLDSLAGLDAVLAVEIPVADDQVGRAGQSGGDRFIGRHTAMTAQFRLPQRVADFLQNVLLAVNY